MVTFLEAYRLVMDQSREYGKERVSLKEAGGRILAEDVCADRDFPPFDRATKDGIAIRFAAVERGRKTFEVQELISAGQAPPDLQQEGSCFEIMTGAVVPRTTDTVIMYEHLDLSLGIASLKKLPRKGQNIHKKGSDLKKGGLLLPKNTRLNPADIGILAAVGMSVVPVKKLPRVAVVSTGNELVEIGQDPLPHQVRRSNVYSLHAALQQEHITAPLLHVLDDRDMIRQKLYFALQEMDVLLISGGVSRGKADFIPRILGELGVERMFHQVKQRPGKPFWFGVQKATGSVVFSFPGNPVSTFANYHVYFRDWLRKGLGLAIPELSVILEEEVRMSGDSTLFIGASISGEKGQWKARPVASGGSGDLVSLTRSDGFIRLDPARESYPPGSVVPWISTRILY